MQRHHLVSALACILFASTCVAAEEKPLPDRIAENIQKLSHDRFSVRAAATRDLLTIGEPALKALKLAAGSKDAEVRRRVEVMVRDLEDAIQNEALLRAPKLHLKYDAKPLDEAIADLAQKTGIAYMLDPKLTINSKKPITLDTGEVPFWEAVEKFLATAGLVEAYAQAANPLQPQPNPWTTRRYSRRGPPTPPAVKAPVNLIDCNIPLASSASTLIRVKVLPKDAPGTGLTKGSNEIQFVLDVTPAPSLTWLGTVNVDIRRALDERGATLAQSHLRGGPSLLTDGMVNSFDGQIVIQGGGQLIINDGTASTIGLGEYPRIGNWRHLPVSLLGVESASKSLKQLEGVITARVLTQPQTLLSVENIITASNKTSIESGQYRVEITEHKIDKSGYVSMKFRMVSPASPANGNEFLLQQQLAIGGQVQFDGGYGGATPAIAFHDANGKKINNVSLSVMEQTFNGETQTTDYQAVVPARGESSVKLLLTGRKSVTVKVPFALKDVPLP